METERRIDWETAVSMTQEYLELSIKAKQIRGPTSVGVYRDLFRTDSSGHASCGRLLAQQRHLAQNENEPKNGEVYDEIIGFAEAMLRESIQLPPWLAEFTADVISGKRKRPSRPGSDKGVHRFRDAAVTNAIALLIGNYGLPAYSNNSAHRPAYFTACSTVAEAFRRGNIPQKLKIKEGRIKQLWDNRGTSIPDPLLED